MKKKLKLQITEYLKKVKFRHYNVTDIVVFRQGDSLYRTIIYTEIPGIKNCSAEIWSMYTMKEMLSNFSSCKLYLVHGVYGQYAFD